MPRLRPRRRSSTRRSARAAAPSWTTRDRRGDRPRAAWMARNRGSPLKSAGTLDSGRPGGFSRTRGIRSPAEGGKRMRAVDALMEALKAEGVEVVFGLPGGANLPTYDALYDAGMRHILVRHEAGGGHAAEGYAKATGKVGVAFGTSGPGATNLVTPICRRDDGFRADGLHHRPGAHGPARHRRLPGGDTGGITMPIVKHSFMVQDPREIPQAIHEAFYLARSGRPGPVLVDIPQDLSRADIVRAGERHHTCPATSRPPRATRSRSAWPPRRWPTRAGR